MNTVAKNGILQYKGGIKMMKNKLMMQHKELVRMGKFQEARKLLDFLIEKRIVLGFSDIDNYIENLLDALELPNSISGRSWCRTFFLK